MARDQQGLELKRRTTSAEACERAAGEYYGWRGDPLARSQKAVDTDRAFNLGSSAIASLFLLNGFRGDNPAVSKAIGAAEAAQSGASSREKRHLAAARAWAAG